MRNEVEKRVEGRMKRKEGNDGAEGFCRRQREDRQNIDGRIEEGRCYQIEATRLNIE